MSLLNPLNWFNKRTDETIRKNDEPDKAPSIGFDRHFGAPLFDDSGNAINTVSDDRNPGTKEVHSSLGREEKLSITEHLDEIMPDYFASLINPDADLHAEAQLDMINLDKLNLDPMESREQVLKRILVERGIRMERDPEFFRMQNNYEQIRVNSDLNNNQRESLSNEQIEALDSIFDRYFPEPSHIDTSIDPMGGYIARIIAQEQTPVFMNFLEYIKPENGNLNREQSIAAMKYLGGKMLNAKSGPPPEINHDNGFIDNNLDLDIEPEQDPDSWLNS